MIRCSCQLTGKVARASRSRVKVGGAVSAMLSYDWPGNVRELENMVARGIILGRSGEPLRLHHLFTSGERLGEQRFELGADGRVISSAIATSVVPNAICALADFGIELAAVEHNLLVEALKRAGGNRSAAARSLGLTRAGSITDTRGNRDRRFNSNPCSKRQRGGYRRHPIPTQSPRLNPGRKPRLNERLGSGRRRAA